MLDHRASPGIPPDVARKLGLLPHEVGEGALFEGATLTCKHCGNSYNKNPRRIRAREYCKKCDHYICDGCAKEACSPTYIHRSKEEVIDSALTSASRGESFDLNTPKSPLIIVP